MMDLLTFNDRDKANRSLSLNSSTGYIKTLNCVMRELLLENEVRSGCLAEWSIKFVKIIITIVHLLSINKLMNLKFNDVLCLLNPSSSTNFILVRCFASSCTSLIVYIFLELIN